jgi:hypothetical protein
MGRIIIHPTGEIDEADPDPSLSRDRCHPLDLDDPFLLGVPRDSQGNPDLTALPPDPFCEY